MDVRRFESVYHVMRRERIDSKHSTQAVFLNVLSPFSSDTRVFKLLVALEVVRGSYAVQRCARGSPMGGLVTSSSVLDLVRGEGDRPARA